VQPVLGLHGWEDNANTFDTLVPLLKIPSFLAVDMMGHGMSSRFPAVGAHNFLDFVILLRRIADHFKWTKLSVIGNKLHFISTFFIATYDIQSERKVPVHLLELECSECTYGYHKCWKWPHWASRQASTHFVLLAKTYTSSVWEIFLIK